MNPLRLSILVADMYAIGNWSFLIFRYLSDLFLVLYIRQACVIIVQGKQVVGLLVDIQVMVDESSL